MKNIFTLKDSCKVVYLTGASILGWLGLMENGNFTAFRASETLEKLQISSTEAGFGRWYLLHHNGTGVSFDCKQC